MGLYLGNKPGVIYKGDYKPVNLYLGGKKVAGWQNVAKSGEAVEWDETYNDYVGGTIIGRSVQNGTPAPNATVPILSAGGEITSRGRNLFDYNTMMFSNATKLGNNVISFRDKIYDRILGQHRTEKSCGK